MANTKKSTKAKTKTSKAKISKPNTTSKAGKTTKKTTSIKTTKPVVTKKADTTKKEVKKSTSKQSMLQKIYTVSIALYVAIAGAAYFLMNDVSYQLSVGFWGKDELKSVNGTQFAPATQGIVDIQIKWVVMSVAILSLVVPILYLTKLKKSNEDAIKTKISPIRWIEMAVLSAIMIETVAIMSGVLDIATLKIVGGLMVVTMILGWMAEKRTVETGKAAIREYYLGFITGLLPWVLIFFYAVCTVIYGDLRSPWYVYALYAVMLIGSSILGKHQLRSLKSEGKFSNYELVEQKYSLLSLVLRTAFSVVLIVGLLAK